MANNNLRLKKYTNVMKMYYSRDSCETDELWESAVTEEVTFSEHSLADCSETFCLFLLVARTLRAMAKAVFLILS